MNDARRFLRYVIPGSLYLLGAFVLLLGLLPSWTMCLLKSINKESVLVLGLGWLVASGVIGFVLSVFHHWSFWSNPEIDHTNFLAGYLALLRNRGFVIGWEPKSKDAREAWVMVNSLWHGVMNDRVRSATDRAVSLADFMHSVGTARVACWASIPTALVIALFVSHGTRSLDLWVWAGATIPLILILALALALGKAYRLTALSAREFVESILQLAVDNKPPPESQASSQTWK